MCNKGPVTIKKIYTVYIVKNVTYRIPVHLNHLSSPLRDHTLHSLCLHTACFYTWRRNHCRYQPLREEESKGKVKLEVNEGNKTSSAASFHHQRPTPRSWRYKSQCIDQAYWLWDRSLISAEGYKNNEQLWDRKSGR